MPRSSPFDEHVGAGDIADDFPAIDDGQFVFEGKCLEYNEGSQTNDLDGQLGGEESSSDFGATVLWKHVIKDKKCGSSHGGSHAFKCKHCHRIYHGTYTRVYAHLMGHKKGESKGIGYCSAVKADKNLQMLLQREVEQAEISLCSAPLKRSKLSTTSVVTSSGPSLALSYTNPIEKVHTQEGEDVDSRVIRCFCANGIPFDILRSPYWEEMVAAISRTPGYKSPSCERAQAVLLGNERNRVEKEFDDFKQKWAQYGVSITLSGWSDIKNQLLINFSASNQFGSMFLHALEYPVVQRFPRTVSECMFEVIESVRPHNIVQMIMDDEPSCRALSVEVEKVYPCIFWTPCMVHTMKLIIKDLKQASDNNVLSWIDKTYTAAKGVVKYIVHHPQAAEIFQIHPKLELLKAATTKWAHYIILRLLLDVRDAVRAVVLSEHWAIWEAVPNLDTKIKLSGDSVKAVVLSDSFWGAVQLALCIIKPIYKMIRFTEQEGPLIGEVCERMDNMLGEIKENLQGQEEIFLHVSQKVLDRWNKKNHPLYCLAYALMPKYYDEEYFQLPAPGGMRRCKPDCDDVVFTGASNAIQRMHPSTDLCDAIRIQFLSFTEKQGRFSSPTAKRDARNPKINILQWWKFHGGDTKELRDVAFKVLAQPISSLSVERPWNTYNFIQKAKRNSLNMSHADDLTFVHSNLRLLSRFGSDYRYGPHRKWDVNSELPLLDESALKWGDIRFVGLEDENSASRQLSQTQSAIQELLRIIEDVPSNSAHSVDQAQVTRAGAHPRGRSRGVGVAGRIVQKGKTKKFL